jgi:hypothetical protein
METEQLVEGEKPKRKKRLQQLMRTFSGDDADFLEKNRVIRTIFLSDLAAFTAIDPALDAAFATNWLAQIELCEAHPSDATMLYTVQEVTENMAQLTANALRLATELEFYVKKAFPLNPALWEEFAFGNRSRVLPSTRNTVFWLFVMGKVARDYETQLLAAGMPANHIDQLNDASGLIAEAEFEQEYTKRLRQRQTRLRVQQLNQLHATLQQVQKAAAVVFYHNETKRKEYGN